MRERELDRWKIRLSSFADWAIRLLIVGCFMFIWKMYESQQAFIRKQDMTDVRITQLENQVTEIKSKMITWDTLKRVELALELLLTKAGIKHEPIDLTSAKEQP